ncbi:helix-turn-helix domain-containing protein [Pseudomonas sp. zbq_18]|uniref:helix-turn-helix domain-containing protein n=1 Tax=Pseudomonas sp. zbq_18 TaxID=3367251 RepID=UPI00370B0EAE
MDTLAHRIKAARKYATLTQKQLADAAKVEQPLISQLETGKTLKTAYLAHIAKACRVSALWLATGEGVMVPSHIKGDGSMNLQKPWDDLNESHANVVEIQQPHRLAKEYPLISWVAAGSWQESCDNFAPGSADEWLLSTENAGPHGYWLEVKGNSMLPTFTPGMRILVRPEGFDLVSGKYYIAKLLDTGETTFKQFVRDAGVELLQPLNQAFPIIPITDNVRLIGQVIEAKLPPIF